jgi:hypothetical protein
MDDDLSGETCGCPEEVRQVAGGVEESFLLEAVDNF